MCPIFHHRIITGLASGAITYRRKQGPNLNPQVFFGASSTQDSTNLQNANDLWTIGRHELSCHLCTPWSVKVVILGPTLQAKEGIFNFCWPICGGRKGWIQIYLNLLNLMFKSD